MCLYFAEALDETTSWFQRHWTQEFQKLLNYNPADAANFDNGVFWIDYKSLQVGSKIKALIIFHIMLSVFI